MHPLKMKSSVAIIIFQIAFYSAHANWKPEICKWVVAIQPTVNLIQTQFGTNDDDFCLALFAKFKGKLGIFCKEHSICGFDLDLGLETNAANFATENNGPIDICMVMVRGNEFACEDAKKLITEAKWNIGKLFHDG